MSSSQSSLRTNGNISSSASRRYRRIAYTPQVEENLFGESNRERQLKARKNDRTVQAGRNIISNRSSNQDEGKPKTKPNRSTPVSKGKVKAPAAVISIDEEEVHRMKGETKIMTASELEAMAAARDEELERQRLSSKARKEYMMKLSAEAAKRAPKTEMEQIFEAEKEAVLRRAKILHDQDHDSVKLMRTLGARAQAFTIRDEQLKVKKELEEDHRVYDDKMNMLMEIDRLEGLKRQEAIDDQKKQKRLADRQVLEDQIQERRRRREAEAKARDEEAQEMVAKMKKQQEEEAEMERLKAIRNKETMEEIHKFNEETKLKKLEVLQQIKEEEDRIAAYQQKKAEEMKRQEEEEKQRRHEAELRCAKLRSMQEKMANEKAELDELRAKRAAEGRERQAREADLALARKQKAEMEELKRERDAQAMHRQRARVNEAMMQEREYKSIMSRVEEDKELVRVAEEAKKKASMEHRQVLQRQIEVKEKDKKKEFATKQEEGRALKKEYETELEKLERLRVGEVEELVQAGVNPLYLSEMKALDINKIRNR